MKYSVTVEVFAKCSYEVEVFADNSTEAETKAMDLWREKTPADFQVDKGYIESWEAESTQLTWRCQECSTQIEEKESREHDELCKGCFAKFGVAS